MKYLKAVYAALTVFFLIAPLLVILPLAFTSSAFLTYPIPAFSTRWFEELAVNSVWSRAILNSLIIAGATTLLATVLGTLAALGLRAQHVGMKSQIRTLFLLPMVKMHRGQMINLFAATMLTGPAAFALLFAGIYLTEDAATVAVATQMGVPFSTLMSVLFLGETIRWRVA